MKHQSKDWPVLDSQVLHYTAWKLREWVAHHEGLQSDVLRIVMVETVTEANIQGEGLVQIHCGQVWEYLDLPTCNRTPSSMT